MSHRAMSVVMGLVRVPAGAGLPATAAVVWDSLLVSAAAAQLLGQQFLDEDEARDGDGEQGDQQSLLGDQTDSEQSDDSQGNDLQLDDAKDGHQLLEDLLLAASLRHHGAHVSLHILRDDLGEAAGSLGEVPVQSAGLEEVGDVVDDKVLDGTGAGLHTGNGVDIHIIDQSTSSVLSLHDRDSGDQVDLGLFEELFSFAVDLQGTTRTRLGAGLVKCSLAEIH